MSEMSVNRQPDASDWRAKAKVRTLEELSVIAERARAAGEIVVLAHGVFDLMHLGHVRHLAAARREGSMLVVTVTADAFVNKGPGRPVFSEEHRAEMAASVGWVDYVAVNRAPTAIEVLRRIRPSVYVKGSDYSDESKDVTRQITREREEVELHGGRMVLTHEISFSSSNLLNRYFDTVTPAIQKHLDWVRDAGGIDRITELLKAVQDYRVLLVGETIVDEYRYVSPMGKTPKEHIVATRAHGQELFAGGVIAAANHVADFCSDVQVVTLLGDEDSHEHLVRASLKPNVRLLPMVRRGAPTVRKCRFVDAYYMRKLFEVYYMEDAPLPADIQEELDDAIGARLADFDVVIVTDFGHGMIAPSTIRALCASSRFLAVNTQTNSSNFGYNLITKFPRADYICIDANEARLASAQKFVDMDAFVTSQLQSSTVCSKVIVTDGRHGSTAYTEDSVPERLPSLTETVVDTMGAGDAYFAITAPLVAAGAPLGLVGFVGNAIGAIKVGIVGHRRSVEKIELLKYMGRLLK